MLSIANQLVPSPHHQTMHLQFFSHRGSRAILASKPYTRISLPCTNPLFLTHSQIPFLHAFRGFQDGGQGCIVLCYCLHMPDAQGHISNEVSCQPSFLMCHKGMWDLLQWYQSNHVGQTMMTCQVLISFSASAFLS